MFHMGLTIRFLKPQVNIFICGVNGIDWTNAVPILSTFFLNGFLNSSVFLSPFDIFFLSNAETIINTMHCIYVNVQKRFQKVGLIAGFRMTMIAWGLSAV